MSWNVPQSDAPPRARDDSGPQRSRVRSSYLASVRDAWRHARAERDPCTSSLALALCLFTCDGRARGVPVDALLQTVDALLRPEADSAELADLEPVRAWASAHIIRAFHRAD